MADNFGKKLNTKLHNNLWLEVRERLLELTKGNKVMEL